MKPRRLPDPLPDAAAKELALCQKATKKLVEDWQKAAYKMEEIPALNESRWKKWRDWLIEDVFFNKCAYCEVKLTRNKLHAEHYRPKGEVTLEKENGDDDAPAQARGPDGTMVDHPGYFWIAYDWRNLVPACEKCNIAPGKGTRFPIAEDGRYSFVESYAEISAVFSKQRIEEGAIHLDEANDVVLLGPELLDAVEKPLLLNPLTGSPQKHVGFNDFGVIYARGTNGECSAEGAMSIDVCRLKEQLLTDDRYKHQMLQGIRWSSGYSAVRQERLPLHEAYDKAWDRWWGNDLRQDREEFVAAVVAYIRLANPPPPAPAPPAGG